MEQTKRKRGAQPSNQNPCKHGLYSQRQDKELQWETREAVAFEGLDEEIALLRVKIKSLFKNDPLIWKC